MGRFLIYDSPFTLLLFFKDFLISFYRPLFFGDYLDKYIYIYIISLFQNCVYLLKAIARVEIFANSEFDYCNSII